MYITQIGHFKLDTPIQLNSGVLQGDPMSSVLFNLFLSDFDKKMKHINAPKLMLFNSKAELNYLQFADDIALLAENHLYLQKLIMETQIYFKENCLDINTVPRKPK